MPPYIVLNNRALKEIVQRLPHTPTALGEIHGIGKGKVERYGKSLLAKLAEAEANVTRDGSPGIAPEPLAPGPQESESTAAKPQEQSPEDPAEASMVAAP